MGIGGTSGEGGGIPNYNYGLDQFGETIEITGQDNDYGTYDETYFSSLSPSEQKKIAVNLMAGLPMLMLFPLNNLFQNAEAISENEETYAAFMMEVEAQKHEIISSMLDAWNESIQEQVEQDKVDQKYEDIVQRYLKWTELQSASTKIQKEDTESIETRNMVRDAGSYQEYLRSLTANQRVEEIHRASELIVNNYYDKSDSPVVENSNLAKAALSALLIQAFIVVPMAEQMALQPLPGIDTNMTINPAQDQIIPQMNLTPELQKCLLPTINFFVMDMVKDVTVMLYLKQQSEGKPTEDIEFARAFAAQVLGKVANREQLESMLFAKVPGAENLTSEQLADAVTYTQLFALANALMLFVKVEGGTLQENELKQMLLEGKGIPAGGQREKLITAMNDLIGAIPEGRRAEFVEALFKYVASMPDAGRLTDFTHALNASLEEIGTHYRVINRPLDT